MAATRPVEQRAGAARTRATRRLRRAARTLPSARGLAAVLAVLVATFAGAYLALVAFHQDKALHVGQIRLSVSPGHRGALDVYVPLVDWGARFESIRLPVRLRVDVRTIDRAVVGSLARGRPLNVKAVRVEARDAIADYIKALIAVVVVASAALGLVVAVAVRSRAGPPLRLTATLALASAIGIGVALVVLLPPRGNLANPQYYAYGPDIPRVLAAAEAAQRAGGALEQEVDAQLVGLARLVTAPGNRSSLAGRPTVTLASDLHNNVLALDALAAAAAGGPILFPGDLTDRGSPLESSLVRRIVRIGHPFVFVSGNHDSDVVTHDLVKAGAIVLTRAGRLRADRSHGDLVVRVGGLRIAGYDDPFERSAAQNFADRYENNPSPAQQEAFRAWLVPLLGKVDLVMVHEPALITPALALLRAHPPPAPLVFAVGHTHIATVQQQPNVTVIDDGSIGAGGFGNLAEHVNSALARLVYVTKPVFAPLAADIVTIDPGTGSASARRERLDGDLR